jgi:hypothetical protein
MVKGPSFLFHIASERERPEEGKLTTKYVNKDMKAVTMNAEEHERNFFD